MQNQDKIIISMISDASVFINNALYLDGYRKNIFSNSDLTDGEKQLYKSRNNLCSRLYIEASTNLLKTIYILDGKEYNQDNNLYQLYLNLSNEEQNNLYDDIYQKYNQLQITDGMNLEKYKGKSVKRYTYLVSNYDYNGTVYANLIIYKEITLVGVTGRRMYETWEECAEILESGKFNLDVAIGREYAMKDFDQAFQDIKAGAVGKMLLIPEDGAPLMEADQKLAQTVAGFLGKQMEN